MYLVNDYNIGNLQNNMILSTNHYKILLERHMTFFNVFFIESRFVTNFKMRHICASVALKLFGPQVNFIVFFCHKLHLNFWGLLFETTLYFLSLHLLQTSEVSEATLHVLIFCVRVSITILQ